MAKRKGKSKASNRTDSKSGSRTKESKTRSRNKVNRNASASFFGKHLLPIVLIAITAISMGPVAFNDFVSLDDTQFITDNPVVQNGAISKVWTRQLYSPHYKPLVYLGWIAEVGVFGNNPYVLHTTNLLLHLISTFLVFLCVMRIAQFWPEARAHDKTIAFFTALLFGIHPLHVESVAWAIERKDVLFGMFYLAALLTYLKYLEHRQRKYIFYTAALYMLCLLSKSMGITLIGATFLLDWASGRRDWKQMFMEKWPLYIPLIFSLYLYGFLYHPRKKNTAISGFGEGAVAPPENIAAFPGFYQQILIAAYRYLFFFFHTVIPSKLALVYPRESMLVWAGKLIHLAVLGVALIASLPWLIRKHQSLLLTGIVFFTMGLSPILIEEGPGTNFGSDRYTYIPSIGLFLVIATLLLYYLKKPIGRFTMGGATLGVLCGILAVATFFQAKRWGSSFELYDQAANNYKNNAVALHYRGGANEDLNNKDAAIADYSKSIEINPKDFRPVFARGTLYLKMLKYNEAIADMTKTIELKPDYPKAWVNRGNAYRDLNQNDQAIEDYNVALEMDKHDREQQCKGFNNRGAAFLKKGMFNEALQDFNKVLELDPNYVNGYINRAALYINPGVQKYGLALKDYESALALEPTNVQSRYYHGVAQRYLGNNAEALDDFNQAIALSPNTALYYYSRAQALRALGRNQEAKKDAKKAQSLGYDVPAEYLQ